MERVSIKLYKRGVEVSASIISCNQPLCSKYLKSTQSSTSVIHKTQGGVPQHSGFQIRYKFACFLFKFFLVLLLL